MNGGEKIYRRDEKVNKFKSLYVSEEEMIYFSKQVLYFQRTIANKFKI